MNEPTTSPSAGSDGPGPLAGVRIVDLTTILMGPMASRILADHGAVVGLQFALARCVPLAGIERADLEIHLGGDTVPQVDLEAPGGLAVLLQVDAESIGDHRVVDIRIHADGVDDHVERDRNRSLYERVFALDDQLPAI